MKLDVVACICGLLIIFGEDVLCAAEDALLDVGVIAEPTAHHRTVYLNVIVQIAGVRSVAVVDPTGRTLSDAERRLGDRFRGDGFTSVRDMLSAVRPQLTIVTMEGHRAPEPVIASLEAGSHVVTEKPARTTLDQFERIAAVGRKQNRHVMLAMATRSCSPIRKARELIAAGVLGKPYSVSLLWRADQTRVRNVQWQQSRVADRKRVGGGKLIYHGIHFLDVIQYLLDEPVRENNGFVQNVGGQPIDVEDSAVVSFRFAGGATGVLSTGYYPDCGKQTEIRIWGSLGWLKVEQHECRPLQWYSTRAGQPPGVQTFDYAPEPGLYELFFRDVVNAIRRGTPPPITTAESLQALRVVFAGYRAAGSGRTQVIRLDHDAP